jgi:hypothetical protein
MMDYDRYVDDKYPQLRVVCDTLWDYLSYGNARNWILDNFKNDSEGAYYALKILLHTVYYRLEDMESLIKHGLYDKIYGDFYRLSLLDRGNIYEVKSVSESVIKGYKSKSTFVPLLDSVKPSESGNIFVGQLVHKLGVRESQVHFPRDLGEEELDGTEFLIFVDDCIGSGNQLKRFWNSTEVKRIRRICDSTKIKIYYLVLLGYSKNVNKLEEKGDLDGIKVVVCDILTDRNRVFSDESIVWDSHEERDKAMNYFNEIRMQKGVSFLGYRKLDFAVILNDRIPNWSLPLFWKGSDNTDWKPLIKRKTSA